jgi:hypothetical protein
MGKIILKILNKKKIKSQKSRLCTIGLLFGNGFFPLDSRSFDAMNDDQDDEDHSAASNGRFICTNDIIITEYCIGVGKSRSKTPLWSLALFDEHGRGDEESRRS